MTYGIGAWDENDFVLCARALKDGTACNRILTASGDCAYTAEHAPVAPATDENGNGWWNVWVDNDNYPNSFHSHSEAVKFASRKADQNHKVFTDFD